MGSFSIWHWIIVFILLAVPVVVGVVVWLIVRTATRPSMVSRSPGSPVAPVAEQTSAEARLLALAALHAKGLLTDAEYQQQRAVVIRGV